MLVIPQVEQNKTLYWVVGKINCNTFEVSLLQLNS